MLYRILRYTTSDALSHGANPYELLEQIILASEKQAQHLIDKLNDMEPPSPPKSFIQWAIKNLPPEELDRFQYQVLDKIKLSGITPSLDWWVTVLDSRILTAAYNECDFDSKYFEEWLYA